MKKVKSVVSKRSISLKVLIEKQILFYYSSNIAFQNLDLKLLHAVSEILTSINCQDEQYHSIICHIGAIELLNIVDISDVNQSAINYKDFLTKLEESPFLQPYFEKDRLGTMGFIWYVIRQIDKIAIVLNEDSFEQDFKNFWSFVQKDP